MTKRTPLYDEHLRLGARMVDFAGWQMPLHYGSQLDEHLHVRSAAGMFDVSHMTISDLSGPDARALLRRLVANDVDRLVPGRALYTCMLNERGGVIDDLIIYRLQKDGHYRVVTNAATRDKDLAWIRRQAEGAGVQLQVREDCALIAVQGPEARRIVCDLLGDDAARATAWMLAPFHAAAIGGRFVSRTGYTGEDGFEVMVPATEAPAFWRALADAGVRPCGLGARDTLRLEAGMALYGQDMDEDTTPLEAGLAWTVAWRPADRDFIGRAPLEALRAGRHRQSVGLLLCDKGILRAHQKVYAGGREVGEITSGSYSPTLQCAIAMARVSEDLDGRCEVEVRGRRLEAAVVAPPFVRHGKPCVSVPRTTD
jgi:aminomethyltransferase